MKKFSKFDSAQVKTGSSFELLPKGAYVIKIKRAEECENKNGNGSHIKVAFDIAEGQYKDFYQKQFEDQTDENKHWPYDAVYMLSCPDDDSPQWMIDAFGTFVSVLEDSNANYHWDWDESKWKGLIAGALFRNEQSEKDGNVYDHIRPFWFRKAQAVRDGKFGKLPKDKLVTVQKKDLEDFIAVPEDAADEIPF